MVKTGKQMKEYQVKRLKSIREKKECSTSKRNTQGTAHSTISALTSSTSMEKGTAHRQLPIILSTRPFVSCLFVKYALSQPRLWAKLV